MHNYIKGSLAGLIVNVITNEKILFFMGYFCLLLSFNNIASQRFFNDNDNHFRKKQILFERFNIHWSNFILSRYKSLSKQLGTNNITQIRLYTVLIGL